MRTLTDNQKKVLKFLCEGKTPAEISKLMGKHASSVSEAIRRGKDNIEKAIQTLQVAIDEGLLDENQAQKLKNMLGKI